MNDTLLRKLYSGEVYPAEEMGSFVTENDRSIEDAMSDERKWLKEALSQTGLEHFEELEKLWRESMDNFAFQNFTYGFRLGANLLLEMLTENKAE